MKRVWLLGLCLVMNGQATAEGGLIKLDAAQRSHLDVRTAPPEPVAGIPLAQAPGRVVLPPAKEFAVTAAQSGVITHVNVPLGVKVTKGQVLAEIDSMLVCLLKGGI